MRAPVGLKAPGRRLWVEVMEGYTLDPDDMLILEKACRAADRLARWEKIEARLDDPVVTGSKGQPIMHPISEAIRRETLVLVRLFEQLKLPAQNEEIGRNVASKSAQKAAQARWRGRGRQAS